VDDISLMESICFYGQGLSAITFLGVFSSKEADREKQIESTQGEYG
jgi:hypothetical protein